MTRAQLLGALDGLNRSLRRQGAEPLITMSEAVALPRDNLAAMVALTADRIVTVARATNGTP